MYEQLGPFVCFNPSNQKIPMQTVWIQMSQCLKDKVLCSWVFWSIITQPILIELGIRILLLGALLYQWEQNLLIIEYLPHIFNLNCFFRNFNWVNAPKSSLSKVLWAISSGSTLFAFLLLIFAWHLYLHNDVFKFKDGRVRLTLVMLNK